jgi:hypothetical protein
MKHRSTTETSASRKGYADREADGVLVPDEQPPGRGRDARWATVKMPNVASHTWRRVRNESMTRVQNRSRRGLARAARSERLLRPYAARKIRQRNRTLAMLPYLPAKGLIRYLSTRTATAITLPAYPEPDPAAGSR